MLHKTQRSLSASVCASSEISGTTRPSTRPLGTFNGRSGQGVRLDQQLASEGGSNEVPEEYFLLAACRRGAKTAGQRGLPSVPSVAFLRGNNVGPDPCQDESLVPAEQTILEAVMRIMGICTISPTQTLI
jgi:hypothetical protein